MIYEGKTPLILLLLVVGFFYLWVPAVDIPYINSVPSAFGKMVNRLVANAEDLPQGVIFVGDVMLARDVERKLKSVGQNYPFAEMRGLFANNFVFGNFEAVIPKIHQPTPDFNTRFSVKADNLDSIVAARFTHWSLSNNHSFDFGAAGFEETKRQLNLRGFAAFGHPAEVASSSLTEIKVNDVNIGVIGLNAVIQDPDRVSTRSLIEAAQKRNDLIVVYIHWGDEYESIHNQRQEDLAHDLIDQGVDLIVGHHPHVVQDIETYKDRLIVYSLGNFLFDQYFSKEVQQGLTLKLLPGPEKLTIELVPVSSLKSKIQPQPLVGEEREEILKALAKNSNASIAEAIIAGRIELNY